MQLQKALPGPTVSAKRGHGVQLVESGCLGGRKKFLGHAVQLWRKATKADALVSDW
jgi:hypothetical protein